MLTDHLGTVRDLVSNSGQVVNHIKYDSYGNVISESNPAVKTRYKYTGREFDAETGLQYNRARYYDATIGRFVSEDPIGFGGGDFNFYRYVANRPVSATDPSGEAALLAAFGAGVGYFTGFWANVAGQVAAGESLGNVDYDQAFVSGRVGAVAGALGTNKGLSTAGAFALGGAANLAQYVLTNDRCKWNSKDALFSLFTGIVGGVIGGTVARSVPRFNESIGFVNRNGMIKLMPKLSNQTLSIFQSMNREAEFALNATFPNLARPAAGAGAGSMPSPFTNEGDCGCK